MCALCLHFSVFCLMPVFASKDSVAKEICKVSHDIIHILCCRMYTRYSEDGQDAGPVQAAGHR